MNSRLSSRSRERGLGRWFAYLSRRSASERFLLIAAVATALIAGVVSLLIYNQTWLTTTPGTGGTLREGMVGAPRFVNPVLAITRVDRDLSALVTSGLMRLTESGELAPDLAESVTVSNDGTVYNILLKEGLLFSDGTPLTANDVAFTVARIQDPELKSPLRGDWSEVSVEVISDREINFVLRDAYYPFLENLTLGIIPAHTWSNLSAEEFPFSNHNTEPIGSGPYLIESVVRTEDGLIGKYILVQNPYARTTPKIPRLEISFFENEDLVREALIADVIDATGALTNEQLIGLPAERFTAESYPLPRVFGVFMNQNRSTVLRDAAVRQALSIAIDRDALLRATGISGQPTALPVPTGFHTLESTSSLPLDADRIAAARDTLIAGDWEENGTGGWEKTVDDATLTLSLRLATGNSESLTATAAYLAETWRQLGVEVAVAPFEQSDLVQTVIRPRDYELLLFGMEIGRSLDLYPFWHSSGREDPGLNIALYTNLTGDAALRTYRTATETSARDEALTTFIGELAKETPAIFLYNPSFTYVYRSDINLEPVARIASPSDRFASITDWYMTTESLWPMFTEEKNE